MSVTTLTSNISDRFFLLANDSHFKMEIELGIAIYLKVQIKLESTKKNNSVTVLLE